MPCIIDPSHSLATIIGSHSRQAALVQSKQQATAESCTLNFAQKASDPEYAALMDAQPKPKGKGRKRQSSQIREGRRQGVVELPPSSTTTPVDRIRYSP
ncbi:hypothetical protein BDZ97DRAFT_1923465 [Flammula alnicola]|nr:hypothetical protein BDZ97DRAFT_1923465 [Flammula alnicola]